MGNGQAPAPERQAAQSWTSGAKDLVMTALGSSRIWATLARGIVTEVYWPAVDQPQVKDLGFLVAGDGWWREVKRVNRYSLSTPDPALALPTIVHTGTAPDYQLILRPVVDPGNDTLLVAYDLQGAGARLYPLLAPHLGVSRPTDESSWPSLGADNLAWVDPNGQGLLASGSGRYLCLRAFTGFRTASAGYVGSSDGWTDFAHNQAMRWSYASAGPGVVALIGELAAGTGLLALGFGDSEAAARGSCQASLAAGYDATAAAFRPGRARSSSTGSPFRCYWPASWPSARLRCQPVQTPRSGAPRRTWPSRVRCPIAMSTGGRRTPAPARSPSAWRSSRWSSPPATSPAPTATWRWRWPTAGTNASRSSPTTPAAIWTASSAPAGTTYASGCPVATGSGWATSRAARCRLS